MLNWVLRLFKCKKQKRTPHPEIVWLADYPTTKQNERGNFRVFVKKHFNIRGSVCRRFAERPNLFVYYTAPEIDRLRGELKSGSFAQYPKLAKVAEFLVAQLAEIRKYNASL